MKRILQAALSAVAVLSLSACGPGEPKVLPDGPVDVRIKALSRNITMVSEVGDSLMITHNQGVTNGFTWTWTFFEDAQAVLSRLDEASSNKPYRQIVFMVKVPAQDNLGNKSEQLGMKVFYDKAGLIGANWQNMNTFDMMELPIDIEFKRLGLESADEYCKDVDSAKHSRKFCDRVLAR